MSRLVALLLAVGCAQANPAPPEAVSGAPQANAYFLFEDGRVHPATEGVPTGLHVRGILDGDRFTPVGNVLGDGDLTTPGSPGWLELSDGSFHGAETGRPPFPPWVEGRMTDSGFVPSSRTVNY